MAFVKIILNEEITSFHNMYLYDKALETNL